MKKITLIAFAAIIISVASPVFAEDLTSSQSWTVSADASQVRVEVWGGGGGGGNGWKTNNHHISGFGGGAGGYASKLISVKPGDVYQVTVARGGNGYYAGGPAIGGGRSELSLSGTVIVGAGGGGAGMSGVADATNSGSPGGAGENPNGGAGGYNSSYSSSATAISGFDRVSPNRNLDFNYGRDDIFAASIKAIVSLFTIQTAEAQSAEPTIAAFYSGVAGQGGSGYSGDTNLKGDDGGPYARTPWDGKNPYASDGGSAQNGGAGGLRGRLGRDGGGCCVTSDTWATDGNFPGAGGGGSDTGTGGWGANGLVRITVTQNIPQVCQDQNANNYGQPLPCTYSGPTVVISVKDSQITAGNSTILNWNVSGADSCVASGDASGAWSGSPSPSGGSQSISPTTDTTYVIGCTNTQGTAYSSVTVKVNPPAGSPFVLLSVDNSNPNAGDTINLSWTVTGADTCNASSNPLSAWSGTKSPTGGAESVNPVTTTTYTLGCTNPQGTKYSLVTVTVRPSIVVIVDKPPVGYLDGASCSAINGWSYDPDVPSSSIAVHIYDGPSSEGKILAALTADQPRPDVNMVIGIPGDHGFSMVPPSRIIDGQNHDIYAYGIDTNAGSSNTLLSGSPKTLNCTPVVPPGPTPRVSIIANPNHLTAPGSVTLSWLSTDATSCSASGGGWSGSKPTGGSEQSPVISNTTTFSVTCYGLNGTSASDSVPVIVDSTPTINPVNPTNPPTTPTNDGPTASSYNVTIRIPKSTVASGERFIVYSAINTGSTATHHGVEVRSVGGAWRNAGAWNPPIATNVEQVTNPGFDTLMSAPGNYEFRAYGSIDGGASYKYTPAASVTMTSTPCANCDSNGNPGGGGGGGGVGGGGTGGGGGSSIVTPGFSVSSNPSSVKARTVAGGSGITYEDANVTVNPVFGFKAPVRITADPTSYPADAKVEFSFNGGAFTDNPTADMIYDSSNGFYRVGNASGPVYLTVRVRFTKPVSSIKLIGTPQSGSAGPRSMTLQIIPQTLNPVFKEF